MSFQNDNLLKTSISESLESELDSIINEAHKITQKLENNECFNETKSIVNDSFNKIQDKIEEKRIEFISLVNDAEKNKPKENSKKLEETNEYEDETPTHLDLKVKNLIQKISLTKQKVNSLINDTGVYEDALAILNKPIRNIIGFKNDEIELKNVFSLKAMAFGKNFIPLAWNPIGIKSNMAYINEISKNELIVKGTSCYNYITLNKEFTNENCEIVFAVNATQQNNYFYFGVLNELVNTSSNCMCCNIKNAWYFQNNGNLHLDSITQMNQYLAHNSLIQGEFNQIKFRLELKDDKSKKVYFQINDNIECGPFIIHGSKFRVCTGSCNSSSGNVIILGCYYI